MFHNKYTRGRPKATLWTPEMPVYVCKHRYNEPSQTFTEIKNWFVPT